MAAPACSSAIPEYEILGELGRGAMGVVHLGRHRALDRRVAVKELPQAFWADPAMRRRFGLEARILASLSHPHVVPVYDYVEADGVCVLVMEELPGGTVWDRYAGRGLLPTEACAIVLATCSALEHAHANGVLHRDIKPENLMFAADGTVKVTDFGIAKVLNGTRTVATVDGSILGTPAYMAPEQVRGDEATPLVDVYAAGTMLYQLLCGELPFARDTLMAMLLARVEGDPPPLAPRAPQVPPEIAAVVMSALAADPRARIGGAEAFGCALAEAAARSWGPDWLEGAGVALLGSDRIASAARTVDVAPPPAPPPGRPTADEPPPRPDPPIAPATIHDPVPRFVDAGYGSGAAATPVRPRSGPAEPAFAAEDLAGAEPVEVVAIDEVVHPPARPVVLRLVGVLMFAAAVLVALVGIGSPSPGGSVGPGVALSGTPLDGADDIDLDLDEPVVVTGLEPGTRAELGLSIVGIPVVSTDTAVVGDDGSVELGSALAPRLVTGAMVAEVRTVDASGAEIAAARVPVRLTNPWYTSASAIGAIVVAMFGVAAIESNLRGMQRGRVRVPATVGLVLSGAVTGVAVAVGAAAIVATPSTIAGIAVPAVLAAGGAVVTGVAVARSARRRRMTRRLDARSVTQLLR